MDCLVLPMLILKRRCSIPQTVYQKLEEDDPGMEHHHEAVTVVVGEDRKEFVVDTFVLDQDPFRILFESVAAKESTSRGSKMGRRVIHVDHVDSILFEHMLWLIHNDRSALFKLDLEDIIDFYAEQDS